MNIISNKIYLSDIKKILQSDLPFLQLKDKSFLISGATGMIGSCLIDTLMLLNEEQELNISVIAIGRSEEKFNNRFSEYIGKSNLSFIQKDVAKTDIEDYTNKQIDYIFHLASNTHPLQYSQYPIETITTNVIGLQNLLEVGYRKHIERFIFASSVEIYGENRGDIDKFTENYLGYINCNTLRAGYPESKRLSEALCQAYIKEKNMDIVIPRLSRTYGPTMSMEDSKALSQFIKKALTQDDIVLKSEGNQLFSYTYVTDAVNGLLYCLLKGKKSEAYNIADETSDIQLKDLAQILARLSGRRVIFELPDDNEKAGYSTAKKAIMDNSKIKSLGWQAQISIKEGLKKTIQILNNK